MPDLYILVENKRVIDSFHYKKHIEYSIPFTKLYKEFKKILYYLHKVMWQLALIRLFAFNAKCYQHISIKLHVNSHQDCKKRLTIETQKGQWTSRQEDSSRIHQADSGWPFPDLSASQTRAYGEACDLICTGHTAVLLTHHLVSIHVSQNSWHMKYNKKVPHGMHRQLEGNKPTNLLNIDVVWMVSQVSQRIDILTVTTGS